MAKSKQWKWWKEFPLYLVYSCKIDSGQQHQTNNSSSGYHQRRTLKNLSNIQIIYFFLFLKHAYNFYFFEPIFEEKKCDRTTCERLSCKTHFTLVGYLLTTVVPQHPQQFYFRTPLQLSEISQQGIPSPTLLGGLGGKGFPQPL